MSQPLISSGLCDRLDLATLRPCMPLLVRNMLLVSSMHGYFPFPYWSPLSLGELETLTHLPSAVTLPPRTCQYSYNTTSTSAWLHSPFRPSWYRTSWSMQIENHNIKFLNLNCNLSFLTSLSSPSSLCYSFCILKLQWEKKNNGPPWWVVEVNWFFAF